MKLQRMEQRQDEINQRWFTGKYVEINVLLADKSVKIFLPVKVTVAQTEAE